MDISVLVEFFVNFAVNNPKLAGFCAMAYLVGLGAKLGREAIEKFVAQSPSLEDDKKLAEIQAKPAVKIALFVLDLLFRLKKPSA